MRIIQVIRTLGFGGAENHVVTLSLKLRERGHDVLVVSRKNSWVAEQCKKYHLPWEHLRMRGMGDIFSFWKLHKLIKSWNADIVHGHLAHSSQYAKWAVKGTKAVAISTAHSTVSSKRMHGCHHIIAVSDAVMNSLVEDGYSQDIITRVYNGVPDIVPRDRNTVRRELGIPEDCFAVVCAGRFQPDKGQDLLVQIAKLCPKNIHFYFMGNHTTDFGQEVVADAENKQNIHFLGYRNDVQQILSAFDVYASPSRKDAFPLSLLEASAAKLPIVANQVGGIPEIVQDGETGILVSPLNQQDFATALCKLASDKDLLDRMSSQIRKHYENKFTVDHMIINTERVYISHIRK